MMLFRFPAFWISVSSATIQNFQNTVKMICTINAELLEWFMHNDKKAQHFVIFMWICQMFWMFENFDSYLNSSAIRVWGSSYDIMPNLLGGEPIERLKHISLQLHSCFSSDVGQANHWNGFLYYLIFEFKDNRLMVTTKYSNHHIMKTSQHTRKSEWKYKWWFS